MHRLIIALAALLIFGAQLTAPVEAQGSWSCTFDFSAGAQGWSVIRGGMLSGGSFVTTDGYNGGLYRRSIGLEFGGSWTTLTGISVTNSYSIGSFDGTQKTFSLDATTDHSSWTSLQGITANSVPSNPQVWTGSTSHTYIELNLSSSLRNSASYSGSASISSITLQGTGTPPCAATPTPIPPTSTPPPPTPTEVDPVMFAQSNWSCPFDLRSQLQGWQVITGSYVPGAGIQGAYPSTNQKISVTLPLNSGTTLYDIRLDYDSTTGTETILRADGVTFDDANGMPAGNQIVWWQGNQAFNNSLNIEIIGSLFTPATMYLKNVMLRGYGGAPPCSNSGLPQPTPVPVIVEAGNLWTGLADANNTLNSLGPGSVGSGVPNETGRQLFGYVKWLVSPSSADELAGPFAPLISHTGVFIALLFALILVYAIVWAVIWILRFIYWLYRLIVQIIDLVLQVAQVIGSAVGQVGQLIGGFIGSAIKFLF